MLVLMEWFRGILCHCGLWKFLDVTTCCSDRHFTKGREETKYIPLWCIYPRNKAWCTLVCIFTATQITVTVSPSYLQVVEGEEVIFQCRSTGNPPPRVSWTKGNLVSAKFPTSIISLNASPKNLQVIVILCTDPVAKYRNSTGNSGCLLLYLLLYIKLLGQFMISY